MEHNVETLPVWARQLILNLQCDLDIAQRQMRVLENTSALLKEWEWFTVNGPTIDDDRDVYHLWYLTNDNPFKVCALGREDKLLIGRKRKEPAYQPSAYEVMDLRNKTGAKMMDAKRALIKTNGDQEKAIRLVREYGITPA